jgi:hypothetical protein
MKRFDNSQMGRITGLLNGLFKGMDLKDTGVLNVTALIPPGSSENEVEAMAREILAEIGFSGITIINRNQTFLNIKANYNFNNA